MEAIAMNMCRMVDYSEKVTGQKVTEVRTMGGAAKSPLWCQIKADILGRDVITMKNTQDAGAAYDKALRRYEMLTNAVKGLTKELC